MELIQTYKFAGFPVSIKTKYKYSAEHFKNYVSDCAPKAYIEATDSETDAEKEALKDLCVGRGYAEAQVIHKKIIELLATQNVFMFHGACIKYKSDAFIFTADSGVGKSTHASLWGKYTYGRAKIINGDKPLILSNGKDEPIAFGSPWCGKEGKNINDFAKIKAVCILERSSQNRIYEIPNDQAISALYFATAISQNEENMKCILRSFLNFASSIKTYKLCCDMSKDAFKTSFEFLTGEKVNEI